MFTVTYTHFRPSTKVPFFATSSPAAIDSTAAVAADVAAARGFVSLTKALSADQLSIAVSVNWHNRGAHESFEAHNRRELTAYRAARGAYEKSIGGSTTTTFAGN